MKYVDEYRNPQIALAIAEKVARKVTRSWVLMEVCGGQTHTLMRYGIDELLPKQSRVGARAGLSGVRDAPRDGGSRDPDRVAPEHYLHVIRRYATSAWIASRTYLKPGHTALTSGSCIRRWTP